MSGTSTSFVSLKPKLENNYVYSFYKIAERCGGRIRYIKSNVKLHNLLRSDERLNSLTGIINATR